MECWDETVRHMLPESYRFVFLISMLGRFRDEHVRNKGEIRTQLLDELGFGRKDEFLMYRVGVTGVDDLDFELVT